MLFSIRVHTLWRALSKFLTGACCGERGSLGRPESRALLGKPESRARAVLELSSRGSMDLNRKGHKRIVNKYRYLLIFIFWKLAQRWSAPYVWGKAPGFESEVIHNNDPGALQDHCVILYKKSSLAWDFWRRWQGPHPYQRTEVPHSADIHIF